MAKDIEFADDAPSFAHSQQFQDIKNAAHEHLLTRIEELGAEFGRWSRNAINQFVDLMRPLGLVEVSRTGVAAIGRGAEGM